MMFRQSRQSLLVLILTAAWTMQVNALDLFLSSFRTGTEGFTYAGNTFSNRTQSIGYASGRYMTAYNGALEIKLGGFDNRRVNEISGGWIKDFTITTSSTVTIDVRFMVNVSAAYEYDEYNQVLCSIDGNLFGLNNGTKYIEEIYGSGTGTSNGTGVPPIVLPFKWVKIQVGVLNAGTHRLILGMYNNKKTLFNEESQVTFSDISVRYFPVKVLKTKAPLKTPVAKSPTIPNTPVRPPLRIPSAAPASPPLRSPNAAPISVLNPITSTDRFTVRISAGSDIDYVAPDGVLWQADTKFRSTGMSFASCPFDIGETTLDELYCKERFYNMWMEPNTKFEYVISVPRESKYYVKLHFAETFYKSPQLRIFDILVDGKRVVKALDIFAKAGFATAMIVPIITVASKRQIVIELVGKVENPKINAIEVVEVMSADVVTVPTNAPVVGPVDILINCGGKEYDELLTERTWEADQYYIGGLPYSDGSNNIMETVDDQIYQTERYGEFRYEIPVPNGVYTAILHFAELYWPNIGERLFDIQVETDTMMNQFDIVANGGGKRFQAVTLELKGIIVVDGFVSIVLTNAKPQMDHPKLSGIEIHGIR